MITIFDIIQLTFPVFGMIIGFKLGGPFGFWTSIVLSIIGLIIGFVLGKMPFALTILFLKKGFKNRASVDLRQEFAKDDCLIPNILLLELSSRGENLSDELEALLERLNANNIDKRSRAWIALKSAFPDTANMIPDYHFSDSPEVRKRKIDKLKILLKEKGTDETQQA